MNSKGKVEDNVTFISDFIDETNIRSDKKNKKLEKKNKAPSQVQNDDEEIVGPDITKKPKINFLDIILDNLPCSEMYERSLMHRENINLVLASSKMNTIITISVDGHVKFWKKSFRLIDFQKHFRAHTGIITCAAFNASHDKLITVSPADKTIKIFDVQNQDLLDMIKLQFQPYACEFVHLPELQQTYIIVTDSNSGKITIIDESLEEKDKIIKELTIHQQSVRFAKFVNSLRLVITTDLSGKIELWDPVTLDFPKSPLLRYKSKLQTDFYALMNSKTHAIGMNVTHNQKILAIYGNDRIIRVWSLHAGKIMFTLDEGIEHSRKVQEVEDPENIQFQVDPLDFERRVTIEKDIEKLPEQLQQMSIDFDETDTIMIYATLVGIKFYNMASKEFVRLIGKMEQLDRFMKVSLFQGQAMKNTSNESQHASLNRKETDPTLYCTAHKKNRFYVFSKRLPENVGDKQVISSRDILNEKTQKDELTSNTPVQNLNRKQLQTGTHAIMQTTMGEIHINLFIQECPKTCENFITHAKNGYYDHLIFHRVIAGFMIQGGCPKGDGTGGESIWGGEFEDEFHPNLKHDKPFTLSMANAGPNTNGSQFFITVAPCSWLDNKHTVFGRVYKGIDVVMDINQMEVDDSDKPLIDVKIITVRIL